MMTRKNNLCYVCRFNNLKRDFIRNHNFDDDLTYKYILIEG